MKIHAYGDANVVLPIAFPEICCLTSPDLASLIRLSMEICLDFLFFRASFNAFKSSLCGILGYSPTISAVTSIEFFERFLICLIFPRKSPESLMYDQLLYITGFKLLKSFLYILSRKYNFLK